MRRELDIGKGAVRRWSLRQRTRALIHQFHIVVFIMKFVSIVAAAGLMFGITPVALRSGGTQKTCRQEIIRDCVKRLMTFRDPVSGRPIALGDAEQFCAGRAETC